MYLLIKLNNVRKDVNDEGETVALRWVYYVSVKLGYKRRPKLKT